MDGPVPLDPRIRSDLAFQTYPPAPEIPGVSLLPLRKHRGPGGWFMEWLRIAAGRVQALPGDWVLRQVSVSYAEPRRINAFHLHPRVPQGELWTVVHGELQVWLVDCRAGSGGTRRQVLLSGEEPAVLVIPPGVAHGYRAGRRGALLLYAADRQFDPDQPNEGRLPWDYFGRELWEEDRG